MENIISLVSAGIAPLLLVAVIIGVCVKIDQYQARKNIIKRAEKFIARV